MMSAQDLSSYNTIRMAGVIRESIVDGPGLRFVVFAQGCPHGCPGCHNPATHDFNGGKDCALEKILAAIDQNPLLDGVTFSGGEPMCQPEAFCNLAVGIKERGLNLIIYTGYTYEELQALAADRPAIRELLALTDRWKIQTGGTRLESFVSRQPQSARHRYEFDERERETDPRRKISVKIIQK